MELQRFPNNVIVRCWKVLTKRDQKFLSVVLVCQFLLSTLDLLGVALVGVLGALAVDGIQGDTQGVRVSKVLDFLNLNGLTFSQKFSILASGAASLFIIKTILSMIITKKILSFFSGRSAGLTSRLFNYILLERFDRDRSQSSQELLFIIASSSSGIMIGVLATTIFLVSDMILMLVLSMALFLLNPFITILFVLLFGTIGFWLYQKMKSRAHHLGERGAILSISLSEEVLGAFKSFREIHAKGQKHTFTHKVSEIANETAKVTTESSFMPNIGKYTIEIALVISTIILSFTGFLYLDESQAAGSLALFLAAGSRIAPAVLRIQQSAVSIKGAKAVAVPALNLLEARVISPSISSELPVFRDTFDGFVPNIEIENIYLHYSGKTSPALQDINLEILAGENVAIVGSSGAGKTSLVDCILGINHPTSGNIKISGLSASLAIEKWAGAIAYVPQDGHIKNSRIRDNVTYGFQDHEVPNSKILRALDLAQLSKLISSLPQGLDYQVGEEGAKLSGGEKQRLYIARALITNPKLLILDESTSALDGETESLITDFLDKLKGSTTVISIAHRLSSVRRADRIIYLDGGKIRATGTFDEVRLEVPDFDRQAKLMGL